MTTIALQITSLTIVYSTIYSGADQSKHQSSASLAFVWGIHRGPVNSPHKWPVTRKMFPFDDVIMWWNHDDVTTWKCFQHDWPFVRGIHEYEGNPSQRASKAKLWHFFMLAWTSYWTNINWVAGDLRQWFEWTQCSITQNPKLYPCFIVTTLILCIVWYCCVFTMNL